MIRNRAGEVVLGAMVIGFGWPILGVKLGPYLNYLLAGLMFFSCLELSVIKIVDGFKDKKRLVMALAVVHLASPLIVWILRGFFSPEIYLGMLLVTAVPSGRSSVFLSSIFGGQPEKALIISTVSNILSPVVVPLLVWILAGEVVRVDSLNMGRTMGILVVIPVLAAIALRNTPLIKRIRSYSSDISTVILFFIILAIVSPIRDKVLDNWNLSVGLMLLAIALMMINFGLGYLMGKSKEEKITFAISSSYKNYSMATVVALALFEPIVALPSLVYAIANNLILLPMQLTMKKTRTMMV